MKAYVIAITFSVILCAAADMMVPSQKYRGITRIVCGLFVIGTIVSPVKELIGFDYSSFDSNVFLKGKYEFSSKVEQGKNSYNDYITQNAATILEDEISKEISSVFGQNVRSELGENKLILKGLELSKREEVSAYIKKHYGLNTVYED